MSIMRRRTNYVPGAKERSERLRTTRAKYPFRLVRNHHLEPRPETIEALGTMSPFARFPAKDGDEWLFSTREHRDAFIAAYGGTVLGE